MICDISRAPWAHGPSMATVMAIHWIQFQPDMSLAQLMRDYGTEVKCYRVLYKSRWPRGFQCPACGGHRRSRFGREGRVYYQCRKCPRQTTADQRHAVRVQPAAADDVDAGVVSADVDENGPVGIGSETASGRELQSGVVHQPQGHAGHG